MCQHQAPRFTLLPRHCRPAFGRPPLTPPAADSDAICGVITTMILAVQGIVPDEQWLFSASNPRGLPRRWLEQGWVPSVKVMRPQNARRGIRVGVVFPNAECRASGDIKARSSRAEVTTVADLLPTLKTNIEASHGQCFRALFSACLYIYIHNLLGHLLHSNRSKKQDFPILNRHTGIRLPKNRACGA